MRPSSTLGKHIIQRDPLAKGRACQQCKLRKVRCDGVAPACAACKRTAKFEGRDPELVCCVYNGPKPPSKRAKKPARSVRQSSASSTSAGESEADDLLAKMERQIARAFTSGTNSYASSASSSSPPASASTAHFPIASTSALPPAMPLVQPTLYATTAFDLPPPSAHLLPPALPYGNAKAWSDSTATLVDPLALPPYPPTINTNLPVAAPMAPPPAPALPSEANDSYFPHVPSPGSPGSLRSAWSSSSSGSSVDSAESLHTPPNPAPLFGGEFSLPPDPYQAYAAYPGVDSVAADPAAASFYSLPPAPSGLVDGLDGLAGLGLGYTPGGKLPTEQVQSWVGGNNAWMGLMDPMAGSLWGAAL